jgi:hypothetical protein
VKIKEFVNLSALKIVAASTLAIGVIAGISTKPASAITFNTGELDFGVFTSPFATNVNPVTGNNFNVTFSPTGTTSIFRADGSFSPTFTAGTTINSNSPTVNFAYVPGSGSTYRLNQDLIFNFAAATPTTFTLGLGSTFTETDIFQGGQKVGAGLQLATLAPSFFTNGGNITNVPTLAFSFNDTGIPSGGLFIAQSTPLSTAVPEPFTVIGTLVGGAAALRMRKKLASATKN